jgi:hypothetical protein
MAQDATHPRWPADRFYWSVLDAPASVRPGPLPAGLAQAFEDEVPTGGEALHAVCAPMGEGRIAVCGAPRSQLEALPPGTLSLSPEAIPECVGPSLDASSFNLLVGELEPQPLRRARSRRHLLTTAAALACAALLSLGLLRRAQHDQAVAAAERGALATAMAQAKVSELTLPRELDTLRRAAKSQTLRPSGSPDAAPALAALLAAWPAQVPCKPQSISIDASGASIELSVEGDPSPFLRAFKAPQGWTLAEPRLNTAGSLTRLSLTLRRAGGGEP